MCIVVIEIEFFFLLKKLLEVVNNTLSSWLNAVDRTGLDQSKSIECRHPEFYEKLDASEKNDISISGNLNVH